MIDTQVLLMNSSGEAQGFSERRIFKFGEAKFTNQASLWSHMNGFSVKSISRGFVLGVAYHVKSGIVWNWLLARDSNIIRGAESIISKGNFVNLLFTR